MIDLQIADGRLETDASLETAIRISLLTDARARPDDAIRGTDLRGWAGDQYLAKSGDSMGSRLWTLIGGKIERALELAEGIALEAVQWMITDGFILSAEAEVQRTGPTSIAISIIIERAAGRSSYGPYEVVI